MDGERFTDSERQLLLVFITRALVGIRHDPEFKAETDELMSMLKKIQGVDTVLYSVKNVR